MDIYEFFMRRSINGAPRNMLLSILEYRNRHLTVEQNNGRLLLKPVDDQGKSDLKEYFKSRIIKCVREYYRNPDEPLNIKSNNAFLTCDRVRDNLGIKHVSRNDCRSCHICANRLAEDGGIEYK